MRRRDVLAATGTAGLAALAGCSAIPSFTSQSCEPAADSLGDVSIDRDDYEYEYTNMTAETFEVRGTVAFVHGVEGLWITDGTGYGNVTSAKTGKVIDPEAFSAGDCVSASGRLNVLSSEDHGLPSISAGDLSKHGTSDADVGPVGFDVPSPRFDAELGGRNEPMKFLLTEGEVAAGNLVVRHQPQGGTAPWPETAHDTWAGLSDLSPEETVPEGHALEFDDTVGLTVLYDHPETGFTKKVSGEYFGGAESIEPDT